MSFLSSQGGQTSHLLELNEAKHIYYRVREVLPLQAAFDKGAEGWTATTNTEHTAWEMGTAEPMSPENLVWATNLEGDFTSGVVASLRSPVVDLTWTTHASELRFRYTIDTLDDTEGGQLRFLTPAGDHLHTHRKPFTGKADDWTQFALTLPHELRNANSWSSFSSFPTRMTRWEPVGPSMT